MFRGRFEHTIDPKGRVSIPAKFRELLGEKYDDRLIITTGLDSCLVAFPYGEWVNVEEKVSSLSMVKKEVKAFQRVFISGATECPIDKLGRVLIPPTLRSHAQLEKDVVFAGMLKKFERRKGILRRWAKPLPPWASRSWESEVICRFWSRRSSSSSTADRTGFTWMEPWEAEDTAGKFWKKALPREG